MARLPKASTGPPKAMGKSRVKKSGFKDLPLKDQAKSFAKTALKNLQDNAGKDVIPLIVLALLLTPYKS